MGTEFIAARAEVVVAASAVLAITLHELVLDTGRIGGVCRARFSYKAVQIVRALDVSHIKRVRLGDDIILIPIAICKPNDQWI